ncbi:MAG: hypothetical protein AAB536_02275 [Patescibacteria group bacterium]
MITRRQNFEEALEGIFSLVSAIGGVKMPRGSGCEPLRFDRPEFTVEGERVNRDSEKPVG